MAKNSKAIATPTARPKNATPTPSSAMPITAKRPTEKIVRSIRTSSEDVTRNLLVVTALQPVSMFQT